MPFPRPLLLRCACAALALVVTLVAPLHAGSRRPPPMRYLALGDSYTIGEGVPEDSRWPRQLTARLRSAGHPMSEPQIIARTGWTTDELDAAITRTAPAGDCALVTLLIGVNNQYRGRSLEEYRTQFSSLLDRAVAFADGRAARVIVVSIPDWGVTTFAKDRDPGAIAERIDAFNAAAKDIALARGAHWVSVTEASRAHGDDARFLVEDGLHPSAEAYAEWARLVEPVARRALSR